MKQQQVIEWIGTTPRDWLQSRIKAVFRDNSGSISMQQLVEMEVEHYSIPNFDAFGAAVREDGATIASNKTLLHGGEILYSKLNCHKPRVWLTPHDEQVKVASTEFIPLSEWHPGSIDKRFMVYLLGSAVFAEYMTCFQTSVTNSHRRNGFYFARTNRHTHRLPQVAHPRMRNRSAAGDGGGCGAGAQVEGSEMIIEVSEKIVRLKTAKRTELRAFSANTERGYEY